MMERYRKGQNAAMDAAYTAGKQYGKVRVGGEWLFFRKGLFQYVLNAAEIVRAFRREEQVQSHTSCCESDFNIHRLILEMRSGEKQTITIGDGLFRHEPEHLLENMQILWPEIIIGVPQQQKP